MANSTLTLSNTAHADWLKRVPFMFLLLIAGAIWLALNDRWTVQPQDSVDLSQAPARVDLAPYLKVLHDAEGRWSADQVRVFPSQRWSRNRDASNNFGYSGGAYWLSLRIQNDQATPRTRILSLDYHLLDRIELHWLQEGEPQQTLLAGDRVQESESLQDRLFAFSLTFPAHSENRLLLRLSSRYAILAPLTLSTPNAYKEHEASERLLLGICFGILGLIFAYNLIVYGLSRQRVYLYYGLVCGGQIVLQLFVSGVGQRYVWSAWAEHQYWVLVSVAAVLPWVITLFMEELLDMRRELPRLMPWLRGAAIVTGVVLAIYNATNWWWLGYCWITVLVAFALVFAYGVAKLIRRDHLVALQASYGWFLFLGGLLLHLGKEAGVLINNEIMAHALLLGMVAEVVCFSVVLALKVSHEKRERGRLMEQNLELAQQVSREMQSKMEAQEQLLEIEQRSKDELEYLVAQRTDELNETLAALRSANERLQHLNETDPLTGASNRRYLSEHLSQEYRRARREQRYLSVIVLDIDHFKTINDNFGHQAGDECLCAVTRICESRIRRPPDFLVRYGGEEFVVVLPETPPEGAWTVAEALRSQVAEKPVRTSKGVEIPVTISLGITSSRCLEDMDPQYLIDRADQALYQAKQDGRNQVKAFSPDQEKAG